MMLRRLVIRWIYRALQKGNVDAGIFDEGNSLHIFGYASRERLDRIENRVRLLMDYLDVEEKLSRKIERRKK